MTANKNTEHERSKKLKNKKLLIVIILILIVIVFLGIFKDKILKIIYPKTFKEYVSIYSEEYNIDENLIYALMKAESNFKSKAVSNRGAIGVMQLMEETALDVAKKAKIDIDENNLEQELLKPEVNIKIGTIYIKTLLNQYQNVEVTLAAYNAGIGTVNTWIEEGTIKKDGSDIENIPYKETNQYVRKILRDYKIYEYLYG